MASLWKANIESKHKLSFIQYINKQVHNSYLFSLCAIIIIDIDMKAKEILYSLSSSFSHGNKPPKNGSVTTFIFILKISHFYADNGFHADAKRKDYFSKPSTYMLQT